MKWRSLQLNSHIVLLIENSFRCLKVYYVDGHWELIQKGLYEFADICGRRNGYKNPIEIGNDCLFPTQNKREISCCWVNLHHFDCCDRHFIGLLNSKNLLGISKKQYLHHKSKHIKKDGLL